VGEFGLDDTDSELSRAAALLPELLCRIGDHCAGTSIRKVIQVSLMEGRPCTERVESALQALRQDISAQIERELSLLATRALKPLFCCVAPALLGFLAMGLYLGWVEAMK
jgi:hypothetical protein